MNDNLSYFERRLNSELIELESQISALLAEKNALSRQLAKVRAERTGIKLVGRKNSVARVLAENAVIVELRSSKRPMKVNELFDVARRTNHDLKPATFRSYLHRMKERGELVGRSRSGWWSLPHESQRE